MGEGLYYGVVVAGIAQVLEADEMTASSQNISLHVHVRLRFCDVDVSHDGCGCICVGLGDGGSRDGSRS